MNRWTTAARGTVPQSRQGIPQGELNQIICMSMEWSKIPNTLLEDEAGQLWLAFMVDGTIDDDGGYEPVDAVTALEWLQHVSEFTEGYDCDVADVCRIALAELARRPSDMDRVKAGTKFGRAQKTK